MIKLIFFRLGEQTPYGHFSDPGRRTNYNKTIRMVTNIVLNKTIFSLKKHTYTYIYFLNTFYIIYHNKTIRMVTNIVRNSPEDIVRGAPFTDCHRRGAHLPLFQHPVASGGLRHRRIGVGAGAGPEPLATGYGARGQVAPRGHAAFGCGVLPIGAPLHIQKWL